MCAFFCAATAAQETNFVAWEDCPGLHFYLVQDAALWNADTLSVTRTPVRDHVRGDHALELVFRATRGDPGVVVYRPPGFAVARRQPYRALSFWVKGDGSKGIGVIGIGEGQSTDPRARFRLVSKDWEPVRLRWGEFDRAISTPQIQSIFFGVTPETKRPASYVIDRIELARSIDPPLEDDEVRASGRKAAKLREVPQPKDLSTFVMRRDTLATSRTLVKAKKPVRVLVMADAVGQGAGLWNVPAGVRSRYLFWGVLERELKEKGSAASVTPVFVEDPEDAAGRIDTMLRRQRPNLVIVQFSTSAIGANWRSIRNRVRKANQTIFAACRRAKADVIALAIPPLPQPLKQVNEAEVLLEEAARAGVATADFGRLAAARGNGFEGEYYATPDQLNVQGHLLVGKLLTSCLTEP